MKIYVLSSACVYTDMPSKVPNHPYTYVFSSEALALQKMKEIQKEYKDACKKRGEQVSTKLREDGSLGLELYIRTETKNLVWICRSKLIDGELPYQSKGEVK